MAITLNGTAGITTPADTVTGNATVGGTLNVTGASTLAGGATIGGVAAVAVAPGANGNVLTSNGTTWTSSAPSTGVATAIGQIPFSTNGSTYAATAKIVSGTAVASTSGTSIDFTSIPSWVKRITVMFDGVSTSGTSFIQFQIGSGSVSTTGYNAAQSQQASGASGGASGTSGFGLQSALAANLIYGQAIFSLLGSNTWAFLFNGATTTGQAVTLLSAGSKTLSGALDRVRITTVNGTDTFDAGSINLLWE